MASWGKVNYNQFKDLEKQLEAFNKSINRDAFYEACAKELAARLLAKVIKRTPVGQYEHDDGLTGGTLRRGWTAESQREAELSASFGGDMGVKQFVENVKVSKIGGTYELEIINPVEYGPYVEYGHRIKGKEGYVGYVPGQFMLTISESEIDAVAPKILEKKLKKYLGEMFND